MEASSSRQTGPEGMLACLRDLPRQCRTAWQMATDFHLPGGFAAVDRVLVIGMGGSAIGGDLTSSLVAPEAKIPIIVSQDYDLPAFVDERTLVIAASYSGMTEETLAAFDKAMQTGAKKLVITTGGRLKGLAEAGNIPVFSYEYHSQPRAALGFGFLPILCFMQKLGFISDKSADVAEAADVMEGLLHSIDADVPGERNPARQLAERLHGRLPVIYGAGRFSQVAHRWKTQLNENSKAWAFYETFPELNHNAIVGYQFPQELTDRMLVVLLRAASLPRPIQYRYRVTCQLLDRAGVGHEYVDAEGKSDLSQLLSLVLLGDYVSYYLALQYGTDPTPVEAIQCLKGPLVRPRPAASGG